MASAAHPEPIPEHLVIHGGQPLLERRGELAEIDATLDAALRGEGRALVVEGAAGVGKTQLLHAACRRAAERGLRVLHARGAVLEHEFSYGVARQLLEPVLAGPEPDLLHGAAARASVLFDDRVVAVPGRPDARFAVLHGLFWLAANLAERGPVLLAVDDLHWADPPSLDWLGYLARRLDGLPVAVVAAARPGELATEQPLLDAIVAEAAIVRPRPLSAEASQELLHELLADGADPDLCRACHEATGGNPLLLAELGRTIAAEDIHDAGEILAIGPRAIARRVEARLAQLPQEVTQLARAAAVLGDGCDVASATELAGLSQEAAGRASATLVGLEILRPVAQLEFVHPLVRACVYAGIGAVERRRRHADAAHVLSRSGAGLQHVAAHLLLAPPSGTASVVVTLRDAARHALGRGDSGAAVAYLRRALDEPPTPGERGGFLVELGAGEMLVDGPAAIDHLREALPLIDDPLARADAAEMLVRALLFAWRYDEGIELATRTIEGLGDEAPEQRRRLEAALLNATMFEPRLRELALRTAGHVRARPAADGLGAKMLAGLVACIDAHACVPAPEAIAWAERALAGGDLIREANGGSPLVITGIVLTAADPDRALPLFDAALEAALEQGSVFAFAAAMTYRSVAHLVRGDLSDAVADAERGLEAAEAHGLQAAPGFAAPNLANALIARGELDAAAAALERAGFGADVPDHFRSLWYRDSRAQLLLARGDTRRGLEATLDCGRAFEAVGGRNPAFMPWRSRAARALTTLGERPAEARRLAAEELELARVWGAPQPLGVALRAQAAVAGTTEPLLEAVAILEDSPARLEHAGALVDLGAMLRRARRPSDARDPLRRGLALADRCGATLLAARAHAELAATGARPRRLALSGPDSLTPSERRVAEMAAAGRTNREIAEALFVTSKTVETHLGHVYGKLDIGSRQALPDALRQAPTRADAGQR